MIPTGLRQGDGALRRAGGDVAVARRGGVGFAALAFAAVALVPSAADAQERSRLRAGEHAGFSRIALDVQQLGEWDATRNGRILTVLFKDRELLFDTSQIFPGRRVSRVTSARSERARDGTRLMLSLSCSCDAETYEFQPGMLVIDIRPRSDDQTADQLDGAGAGDDQGGAPQDQNGGDGGGGADGGSGGSSASGPGRTRRATSELDIRRDELAPATSSILMDDEVKPSVAPTGPAGDAPQAATSEPDAVSVSDAQRRLLQQLSRAADQGLVAFRSPEARDDADTQVQAPPEPDPAPSEPAAPAMASDDARPQDQEAAPKTDIQLDARTAFDAAGRKPGAPAPAPCAAEPYLAPAPWSPGDAPYAEMAELRGKLTAEFDRADPRVALSLARLQIGLGFGVEARQLLEEFAPPIAEAAVLEDLARMADGDPIAPEGPIATSAGCGGRAGMWRLAAGLAPDPAQVEDPVWTQSVLDAFAELPLVMRRRAGPGVVETLIRAGALDVADQARLQLDRAPGDHGDAWRMALGRLALAKGDADAGDALLAAVVDNGGPMAPEAMLDLADSILARRDRLPDQLVEDIALAAFEHQGDLLGRRLLVAEILGRAGRDQLGVALDVIETELLAGGARAGDLEAAMRAILERARAEDVGALDYASAILAHRELIGDDPLFDPARVKVARELTGIGLSNAALELLGPALARRGPEARMAAAAADIAVGDAQKALERLQGLDGGDPAKLRARALAALNRNDEAYASVVDHLPAEGEERAELAWRGSAWEDAEALPDGDPRNLFARWMATRDQPPDATPTQADADAGEERGRVGGRPRPGPVPRPPRPRRPAFPRRRARGDRTLRPRPQHAAAGAGRRLTRR